MPRGVKHGMHGTRTYRIWMGMVARCTITSCSGWHKYGARGIRVCDRWLDFRAFYADMGACPDGMSIDRYPNCAGNYEPNNCRWATNVEQALNKRDTLYLEKDGVRLTALDWSEKLGIPLSRIYSRHHRFGNDPVLILHDGDLPRHPSATLPRYINRNRDKFRFAMKKDDKTVVSKTFADLDAAVAFRDAYLDAALAQEKP